MKFDRVRNLEYSKKKLIKKLKLKFAEPDFLPYTLPARAFNLEKLNVAIYKIIEIPDGIFTEEVSFKIVRSCHFFHFT
jgi:hypothetical protein